MKEILSFIRKKYKYLLAFILGLIVAGTSAYAVTIASNNVTYDNTNSNLSATNVQSAIDELYSKSNTKIDEYKSTVRLLRNSNIINVKKYDQTIVSGSGTTDDPYTYKCVTGNEATCKEIVPGTYETGTIVRYKVNNSTTRTFYVIYDDGDKLVLQDRENIVNQTPWCSGCSTGESGPTTILPAVENATNTWTNVNLQTYTLGETEFGRGSYRSSYTGLTTNVYTMAERTARSRIISQQELAQLQCSYDNNNNCPLWVFDCLTRSTEFKGTTLGQDDGYWSLNVDEDNTAYPYAVYAFAYASWGGVGYVNASVYGGRAVIEINK